jgi:hypothetical protein
MAESAGRVVNRHVAGSSLVALLRGLELPADDFAVAGSGPMLPAGLRPPSDLDVVARGEAWREACRHGRPVPPRSGVGLAVRLFGGAIEVFTRWPGSCPGPDRLIDNAELIDGIRWVRLADVLLWKRLSGRDKDRDDVRLISDHIDWRGAA